MKEAFNATLVFISVFIGLSSLPSEKAVAKVEESPPPVVVNDEASEAIIDRIQSIVPPEVEEPPTLCVSIKGEDQDVEAFISQHYRRHWTYPGTIDQHLVEHDVAAADLPSLTHEQKIKLHSAIHEKELTEKTVSKSAPKLNYAPPAFQNCPGGICPAPQYQVRQSTPRRGLFGRRR